MKKKRVLVAPLNWGLGHATRCIPVIKEFLKQGAEVFIASDGRSLDLLKHEFPQLPFFELKGYDILYPENDSMVFKMALSVPKILSAIKKEFLATRKLVKEHRIDLIFSDNRYGCFSKNAYTVFMTHQLNIQTPASFQWLSPFISKQNKKMISNFDECWVPDVAGDVNLSGALSHPASVSTVKYIGALSRFNDAIVSSHAPEIIPILIICSGPEPQRTVFEKIITTQILQQNSKAVLVRGVTETNTRAEVINNLEIIHFADAEKMQQLITAASLIISRPGYSTIMDLAALGKKAIFIPTPGQTEQEYLASYFMRQKIFYMISQKEFNLEKALGCIHDYTGISFDHDQALLSESISALLSKVK